MLWQASGGELTGKDKEVVGRLTGELKALGEVMGEHSDEEEDESEADDQDERMEVSTSGAGPREKGSSGMHAPSLPSPL